MYTSGGLFLLGALPSVVPFVLIDTPGLALAVAAIATAISLFGVGVAKTFVTRTNPITAGLQNLIITTVGGVAAYYIGVLADAQIG